jgi:membrane-bound serine protease (ClpP class)
MCHLILLLPAFALPVFWVFPLDTALPLYALITAFSLFMYFKIFRAMRLQARTGFEGMLGKKGEVVEKINPEGKIFYAGEIWNATSEKKRFSIGEQVKIGGMRGLMLFVEEMHDGEEIKGSKRCHIS